MAIGYKRVSVAEHLAIQEAVSHIHQKVMPDRMDEPFDGDETEELAEVFRIELDLLHGNIGQGEYEEQMDKLLDHKTF